MADNDKRYPHVLITEKEKGQKRTQIKHKHPKKTAGKLTFTNTDGKELKIEFSAPTDINADVYSSSFNEAFFSFWVVHDLYLAVNKKNHNKAFFYISNGRRSTHVDKRGIKTAVNKILLALKELRRIENC